MVNALMIAAQTIYDHQKNFVVGLPIGMLSKDSAMAMRASPKADCRMDFPVVHSATVVRAFRDALAMAERSGEHTTFF